MTLSFLKSTLKLLFFDLEPPPLFVQFMDGAPTIAQLIKEILDLISEVLKIFSFNRPICSECIIFVTYSLKKYHLVLSSDNIKLLFGLLIGSLDAVNLRAEVAALALACLQLCHDVVSLVLPFAQNLVKVRASLLSDDGSCVRPLILHLEF